MWAKRCTELSIPTHAKHMCVILQTFTETATSVEAVLCFGRGLALLSHFQSPNCFCRSSGLVCCSGWAQLGNECLTRTYRSASICLSCSLLCKLSYVVLLFPLQLFAKATLPVRKTRCVSGQMNAAVVMDTLEPAVTLVRASLVIYVRMICCWYFFDCYTTLPLQHE